MEDLPPKRKKLRLKVKKSLNIDNKKTCDPGDNAETESGGNQDPKAERAAGSPRDKVEIISTNTPTDGSLAALRASTSKWLRQVVKYKPLPQCPLADKIDTSNKGLFTNAIHGSDKLVPDAAHRKQAEMGLVGSAGSMIPPEKSAAHPGGQVADTHSVTKYTRLPRQCIKCWKRKPPQQLTVDLLSMQIEKENCTQKLTKRRLEKESEEIGLPCRDNADRNPEIGSPCRDNADRNPEIGSPRRDNADRNPEIGSQCRDNADRNHEIGSPCRDNADRNPVKLPAYTGVVGGVSKWRSGEDRSTSEAVPASLVPLPHTHTENNRGQNEPVAGMSRGKSSSSVNVKKQKQKLQYSQKSPKTSQERSKRKNKQKSEMTTKNEGKSMKGNNVPVMTVEQSFKNSNMIGHKYSSVANPKEKTATVKQSTMDQAETSQKSGAEMLQSCPLCQVAFDPGQTQMDIDGHIAACLATSGDDVMW